MLINLNVFVDEELALLEETIDSEDRYAIASTIDNSVDRLTNQIPDLRRRLGINDKQVFIDR